MVQPVYRGPSPRILSESAGRLVMGEHHAPDRFVVTVGPRSGPKAASEAARMDRLAARALNASLRAGSSVAPLYG